MLPTCDVVIVQNSQSSTEVVKADDVDDKLPERVTDRQPRQPEVQRGEARRGDVPTCSHVTSACCSLSDVAVQLENAPPVSYTHLTLPTNREV